MNMLRLESYLSPFLLSYLSKYIKDIESKNLQLSLWGGDAVLHNLQFKLNALEDELGGAPFSFVSCQAQELRIHVPWSKLASESVVVTLNTVECVLKLNCHKQKRKAKTLTDKTDTTAKPPSYVESLITKIKNNLTFRVNNLILKYVEDDIVLSVNIQSVLYHSVDESWNPSFIELSESSPVLRHAFELKDVTVCLDKRGASGLVEVFEDPLLFRCHFMFRLHSTYPTQSSRKPAAVKLNLSIDRYELNISENQLPSVLHLLQLGLHLYYGTIEITQSEEEDGDNSESAEDKQGWASWAWSYVPPVISYDVEDYVVKNPIIAYSIYVKKIIVNLKPSRVETTKLFHSSQNWHLKPLLTLQGEGLLLEMVTRGLDFFSCEAALCSGSVTFEGGIPAKYNKGGLSDYRSKGSMLLASCGGPLVGFAANSLFDFRSPENNGVEFEYALKRSDFFAERGRHKTDVFHSQYLYIAEDYRNEDEREELDFNEFLRNVKLSDVDQWKKFHEESWKRFVIGGESCNVIVNSYTLMCANILYCWANDHNLKPYPLASKPTIQTPETLSNISFVPTRSSNFVFKNIIVTFQALALQPGSYKEKLFNRIDMLSQGMSTQAHVHHEAMHAKLPTAIINLKSILCNMKQPMYGEHFAAYLSCFLSPFHRLMEACNTKYTLEIEGLEIYSWLSDVFHTNFSYPSPAIKPILRVQGIVLENHTLQATHYWEKRLTMLKNQTKLMIYLISLNAFPFQLEMLFHVVDSWISIMQQDKVIAEVLDVSLLQSNFEKDDGGRLITNLQSITIEVNQSFVNTSLCGSLKFADMYWQLPHSEIVPIVQCSHHYEDAYLQEMFSKAVSSLHELIQPEKHILHWKEDTHWLTFYLQIPHEADEIGCILVHLHQMFISIDQTILDVTTHLPEISLNLLFPYLSTFKTAATVDPDKPVVFSQSSLKYAIQIRNRGVHLFVPLAKLSVKPDVYYNGTLTQILQQTMKSNTSLHLLCLSFPEITAFTTGFKKVKVIPNLLQTGVPVNKFTDFGTLNFGFEHMSLYTVFKNSSIYNSYYIIKPCTAACTLVMKQPTSERPKANVSLHLDIDPVELKISLCQTELLTRIGTSVVAAVNGLLENCVVLSPLLSTMTKSMSKDSLHKLSKKALKLKLQPVEVPVLNADGTKSTHSALETTSNSQELWFNLWLQCTMPRFSLDIYSESTTESKNTFSIEDISLSLDSQVVYLKLTSSFSTCSITHWVKVDNIWIKKDLSGIILAPMFSVLPSFIQKYDTPKNKPPPPHALEVSSKPGKFFDVTFTKALTSDYQRHLYDECQDSADTANSSVVTSTNDVISTVKRNVSELICSIQAFDLVVNPTVVMDVFHVFIPLMKALTSISDESSVQTRLDFPVLYFTINGCRLFFPALKSETSACNDDVMMACFSSLEVNPHPQNPLSRLVLAPSIYRRANTAGLLHCTGSSMEDKQFEVNIEDISIGTTKLSDISDYLKKPVVCENPALQWNIRGDILAVSDPSFHPIIEQFDLQTILAPSIYHHNSMDRCIIVCGPSVEINLRTDVIFHVTSAQMMLLLDVVSLWSSHYILAVDLLASLRFCNEPNNHLQHEDSGLSVCENSTCEKGSEKTILSANLKLMGDCLITGQRLKFLFYKFQETERIKPFCFITVTEPSFVGCVSKHQQKLEFLFHDASVNVAQANKECAVTIHECGNFPIKLFETQPGDCNSRTGVPSSLCTITIQHFLTKRASLKILIDRAVKINVNQDIMDMFRNISLDMKAVLLSNSSSTPATQTDSDSIFQKFSSFSFSSTQIVSDIECSYCTMRCGISGSCIELQVKNKKTICNMSINEVSAWLKSLSAFMPLLLPVTFNIFIQSSSISRITGLFYKFVLKSSAIKLLIHTDTVDCISDIKINMLQWINSLRGIKGEARPLESTANHTFSTHPAEPYTYVDLLRKGNFAYITADDQEPLPNQIVFSPKLPVSAMLWCYDKPHALKHVHISPIPFNEVLGDHSKIMCTLESYNELNEQYEPQKTFYLSEIDSVDFTLFVDETPFHQIVSSDKWRVLVHNTNFCHVSPLSLAASMEVESVFNPKFHSSVSASIQLPKLSVTVLTQQGVHETELVNIAFGDVGVSLRLWHHSLLQAVADISLILSTEVLEAHNLTWLPVLLPTSVNLSVQQANSSLSASCNFQDISELHISQCVLFSLQHLISAYTKGETDHNVFSRIVLENYMEESLLFGQAFTDECITLQPQEKINYSWRTNKTDPKLHVSVEGMADWNWSDSFYPGCTCKFPCSIDKSKTLIVSVDCSSNRKTVVAFSGRTRMINQMPYEIQASILMKGCEVSTSYPLLPATFAHFFSSIVGIFSISFSIPNADSKVSTVINVSDLTTVSDKIKLVEFLDISGETLYAQVCYYQDGLADVFAVLPIFMIRSFLPNPAVLHIETRCQQKSLTTGLRGSGHDVVIDKLSPYYTHHLTIQLNENESPFDTTVPVHYSLTDTMSESSKISSLVHDFAKQYPYNDPEYASDIDDNWSAGDGNIQAKLSLYRHSLLVEIVPWCLVANETSVILCFTSPDGSVSIIHPGKVAVLHYFVGKFQICTSNSSSSEWLTLYKNPELDHPSRSDKLNLSYVSPNGCRSILLKKKNTVIDLLINSHVHHGIRVLTVTPRWWFVNLSSTVPCMLVSACVSQDLRCFGEYDSSTEINTDTPVPLLNWNINAEDLLDKKNAKSDEEGTKGGSVVSSLEETTSSFLCVNADFHSSSLQSICNERSICFQTSQLVAMVSVKDNFARKLVEFHKLPELLLMKQLFITKHEFHNKFYLVLNDINKEKYTLHNQCSTTFYIREVTDKQSENLLLKIPPLQTARFESYMDAEAFPRCMKMYHSIKMEICEDGSETWTEFLITAKPYTDELLLFDAKLIFLKVTVEEACIHVWLTDKKPESLLENSLVEESKINLYICKAHLKEFKVVLMDDLTHPLYSFDVLHICSDDLSLELSNNAISRQWFIKMSLAKIQVDNQLYPNSDFPVFLSSCPSDYNTLYILMTVNDSFLLDTVEVSIEPLELQCENSFAQALSKLLQSYIDLVQPHKNSEEYSHVPRTVMNAVKVLMNPLRFQSLIIHPVNLLISIRTSIKLSVSIHKGVISFSKFSCRDVDTTLNEITQELTRHYFAEAIYGAGWVIGSLDLLGNPASTIRSFVQGVSDFVVLPYEGLMNGPTAFVGGFTRGITSLLRHFSSGALRSVTNIASGISRNLVSIPSEEQKPKQLLPYGLATDAFQQGISLESVPPKTERSYVTGVTKALVGVVTKPIGGAASLVSRTGETILRKVGLEERKSVRHPIVSHTLSAYHNSLTKYARKFITDENTLVSHLSTLHSCLMVSPNGVNFSINLLLTPTCLHIVRVEDDIQETLLYVKDIELILHENLEHLQSTMTIQQVQYVPDDKTSVYTEKVADYLSMNAKTKKVSGNGSRDHVKYTVELQDITEARLFCATFNLVKPKENRFDYMTDLKFY